MKNPLIFLGRVLGTECHGHHVGLTWNGRLVLLGHSSIAHAGAAGALAKLAGRSRHSVGCAEILAAVRRARRNRRDLPALRAMTPDRHRDALRRRVHAGLSVPGTPYSALYLMVDIGLLEQVPLELWDIVRH